MVFMVGTPQFWRGEGVFNSLCDSLVLQHGFRGRGNNLTQQGKILLSLCLSLFLALPFASLCIKLARIEW